ncbi:MAG: putative multidrug resistance protein EmrY [Paracidovorax wautersii]|uniref:Putative multidrug resistance protein EmrY n=1 Tax=Paracidovorax wautersii TaxID=1177982 RepID=A0A7V8FRF8_9BURK|nr:MAG: putative multidrug resistance protein EmrY [Paracidovorax wautersii]
MNTTPAAPTTAPAPASPSPTGRWLVLLTLMIGTMASVMSSTIINVAIPGMSQHFVLGQERAQWATSSFMLAMTVSMLTTPWLLGRFGWRRTYQATMALLLLGGLAGGLATDFDIVLAARVAEGLAAGVVQPIPAILIMRTFQPFEQGKATGLFTMGVVLAPALGPSVGGILLDLWGWRSIFFMVVPLCVLALALSGRWVPATTPDGTRPGSGASGQSLDGLGLLLAGLGTLALLNGLVGLHGGSPAKAVALLAAALGLGTVFVAWQRRRHRMGRPPLMPMAVFASRTFALSCGVAFIYGAALFGSTYLLPVYMLLGMGLPPTLVGTVMLPAGLMLAAVIPFGGRLADAQPSHRLIMLGLVLLGLSFALMPTLGLASGVLALSLYTVLGRVGLGFILPALNLGTMRALERPLIPQGASVINFVRMLGGAVGVSLCGIVLEWRLGARGQTLMGGDLSPERLRAFDDVFLFLAALCVLAVAAAWQARPASNNPSYLKNE